MVVRATIVDVATSGSLVGRLSAAGTLGAITGTFLTGFYLLGAFPTRAIILATGGCSSSSACRWCGGRVGEAATPRPPTRGRARAITLAAVLVGLLVVGGAILATPNPCERESAYYCIRVVEGGSQPSGRTLMLDQLRHAYVDLDDPNHLEFAYIRWFDHAVRDIAEARDGDFDAVHLGGGGFTFPRHLAAEYPESRHTILELDPIVHQTAVDELGPRAVARAEHRDRRCAPVGRTAGRRLGRRRDGRCIRQPVGAVAPHDRRVPRRGRPRPPARMGAT